jgi:hypothetical protein
MRIGAQSPKWHCGGEGLVAFVRAGENIGASMEAGVAARRVVSVRPWRIVDCWQITLDADLGDLVGEHPTLQGGI